MGICVYVLRVPFSQTVDFKNDYQVQKTAKSQTVETEYWIGKRTSFLHSV